MKFIFFANNPDISFGKQAEILINELRKMGHQVVHIDHNSMPQVKQRAIETIKPDIVVIWTFFHDIGHPTMSIKELPSQRNFFLVGFEVADSTKLSEKAINMVNELNPDIMLTPSKWSAMAFSGVNVPIAVLPHAIDPYIYYILNLKNTIVIPQLENPNYKVYIYSAHSPERKGLDIVIDTLPEICMKYNINVMYKTWQLKNNQLSNTPCKIYYLVSHTGKYMHYGTMVKATHFYYPVRGGAFEIPILEFLAMGKTVIIPDNGAWVDIPLSKEDVYWIKTNGYKRYWFDNPYHVGEFVEPDKNDAKQKLDIALQYPLKIDNKKYLDYYSPTNITNMFLEIIKK